jgi:site-specific recombinase XerC
MIDTTLRPILSYAEEVLEEPVRKIKWAKLRMKEPQGRTRSFTPEEIAAWRDRLPEHHKAVYDFIARYGVRLNEAFFAPEAVNIEAAEIILGDTKNGTHHTLVIDQDDLPDLAARKSRAIAAGLPTVWFSEEKDGLAPIHWQGFQSASKAALVAASIADAKPVHDLRHHAATTLMRSTGNLKLVQDLLNHQSITSSARYAHTSKDDLREALRHTYGTKEGDSEKKTRKIKDA